MIRYLGQRLLQSLLVVVGVVTIVFFLSRVAGDPAVILIPQDAPIQEAERIRHVLGLDRPLYEQYLTYLGSVARGDLGTSFRQRQPALTLVLERLPATLQLGAASLGVALIFGVAAGLVSALRRGSGWDRVGFAVTLVGQSAPPFWLGIVAILVFGVGLRWLPVMGSGGPEYLVLPAITLGAYSAAMIARILRASILDVLRQDYVRTGYSKGLSGRRVIVGHVLKNAAIPMVTIVGLQVGILLGGAIITESVFNYPGMGFLAATAIFQRDFPVVQAYVLLLSGVIAFVNLAVDVLYLYLDPRIKYGS